MTETTVEVGQTDVVQAVAVDPSIPREHIISSGGPTRCCDGHNIALQFDEVLKTRINLCTSRIIRKGDEFEAMIDKYIKYYFYTNQRERFLAIISFLMLMLSTSINVGFFVSNILVLKRDASRNYNFATFLITYIEAGITGLLLFFAIICWTLMPNNPATMICLKSASEFNVLLGLRYVASFGTFVKYIREQREFYERVGRIMKQSKTCCFWIRTCLCFPLLALLMVVAAIMSVLPILAPIGILLRIRQVSFVADVYFTKWHPIEWFRFIGFINNLASLLVHDRGSTKTIDKLLTGIFFADVVKRRDLKHNSERPNDMTNFRGMIIQHVMEAKGRIIGLIICNHWWANVDIYIKMLRNEHPQAK